MPSKLPSKYQWTNHAQYKMRYYRLSPQLIKRVIRFPKRTEQGIVANTIAVMRPAQSKKYQEIWVMYQLTKNRRCRIITAWRYPGKAPEKEPVPEEILSEVKEILGI